MPQSIEAPSPDLSQETPASLSERATHVLSRLARLSFLAAIFLSAFLLFQVQLITGKYILPFFGGTPALWNTCMLCFQVLLLLGYGYSHLLSSKRKIRSQSSLHLGILTISGVVLVLLWLNWGSPLTPGTSWKPQPNDNPVLKIIELLGVTAALPFFVLSTTGPLLQKWFSYCNEGRSPYRLYALSNAGSLLGLVSYPFLFEWVFTIRHQAWLWSAVYIVFTALCATVAWRLPNDRVRKASVEPNDGELLKATVTPSSGMYALWLGLSTCSSTMLLATTNLLCQDIAVIPLLWVLPLAIYLLSFIITFDHSGYYRRSIFWPLYFLAVVVAVKVYFMGTWVRVPVQIAAYCVALFSVCMVCHGELAQTKPSVRHLTSFFLAVATGGALGGIFVVLIAPFVFRGFWEFQIALLICGFLGFFAFARGRQENARIEWVWTVGAVILGAFLIPEMAALLPESLHAAILTNEYFAGALVSVGFLIFMFFRKRRKRATNVPASPKPSHIPIATLSLLGIVAIVVYSHISLGDAYMQFEKEIRRRNFFGVKSVLDYPEYLQFRHGSTIHGVQFKDPAKRRIPTLYFRSESGIGLLLNNYPRGGSGQDNLNFGVIGMGIGTLATYGHPGDLFRFYEIDPAVVELSTGSQPYFHYIEDSRAKMEIELGDGRLSLEREAAAGKSHEFDVLVLDAFSGDAIPLHLITREALSLYLQHIRRPSGVLAFNTTNRYVDLVPVLAGLSRSFHLNAVEVKDKNSNWVLLSENPAMLALPNLVERAHPLAPKQTLIWTDDYSNLFQVLR